MSTTLFDFQHSETPITVGDLKKALEALPQDMSISVLNGDQDFDEADLVEGIICESEGTLYFIVGDVEWPDDDEAAADETEQGVIQGEYTVVEIEEKIPDSAEAA